ncbi:MAG TPA: hypothetical protein PLG90_04180 [Ignavibacteria bacterium]|nr:hypothetical protein [Ignavibacteria bacterium]
MNKIKNLIYLFLSLSFSIIIGAAVYEHLVIWPKAFNSPPQSLSMFQGEFRLNSAIFWQTIHPLTLILFIVTLLLYWKSERKKNIVIALVGYAIVLIVTFIYFVPELMSLISTKYELSVNQNLVDRASLWETLSIIRLVFLIILAFVLYSGLTKSSTQSK